MTQALAMIRVGSDDTPYVSVTITELHEVVRRLAMLSNATASGAGIPTGAIWLTATPTAPPGWLICDGSAVGRADFPTLFTAIGTTFGAGDGKTTFNIPTQAQCVVSGAAAVPAQVITGGSVQPVAGTPNAPNPPAADQPGSVGGNTVSGGRAPRMTNYNLV